MFRKHAGHERAHVRVPRERRMIGVCVARELGRVCAAHEDQHGDLVAVVAGDDHLFHDRRPALDQREPQRADVDPRAR